VAQAPVQTTETVVPSPLPVPDSPPVQEDPYHLDQYGLKEPPRGWGQSLRYLGPGLILSASIVGSGELIATTTLGAQVGFVILWMVLFSCAVKVAVQIEFARWTIATGTPALSGYNRVPPKIGPIGWINIMFVLLILSKVLQVGGIVGGTATAFSILLPIGSGPLEMPSLAIWHGIVIVGTIAMLYSNRYWLIEKGAFYLVVIFSVATVLIALGLPFTPWAYSPADIFGGLTFQLPAAAIGAAIAMFGITGVGSDEITMYNYWCIEKGYARWTGPNDGSNEWVRRAKGWIDVMYKDAILSMVIYTFSTLAFFIMGAAILHRQGLVPRGNEMITTLARMYTDTLGPWAMWLFLIGAIAVLGSTLWAAVPSHARMYANFLATVGVFEWKDWRARLKWIRVFTVALPIIWGGSSLLLQSPVLMVQIGGVMTGVFLVAVLAATWYLRARETDRRVYGGGAFTALLLVSTIAIGLLALYTVLSTLGIFKIT
jgi:Mn2+/Fe2+ NRAMP family transporter